MSDAPKRPADPRPGGRPYYIADACETCGTKLVLATSLTEPVPEEVWNDEWECPQCRDGIYMDWPNEDLRALYAMERPPRVIEEDA